MQTAFQLFGKYMGNGLLLGWYLIMVVYLWKREQDSLKRILFVYFPTLFLLLYFNPLVIRLVYSFIGEEIYYRMLWLLPVGITIGYGCITMEENLPREKKSFFYPLCACLILFSGSFVYSNVHFKKAENLYHMPQAVVEICDSIVVEGREVMAVFPKELLQYVRQYTPLVCMPYGREVLVSQWGADEPIFDLMEEEVIDLNRLLPLCKEADCHYLILPKEKKVQGEFSLYDYVYCGEICGYRLYRDTTMYLGY